VPAFFLLLGACNGDPYMPSSSTTTNTAPAITTQPSSVTVTAGLSATFSVIASGSAPLTYQWFRDGTTINGATQASYVLSASTAADSGATFSVTVSNSLGSVNSNSATLTVQ
jgi:hypothetical protein